MFFGVKKNWYGAFFGVEFWAAGVKKMTNMRYGGVVKLVLVGEVYKPPKLENVGPCQGLPGDKIWDQNFQIYTINYILYKL